MRKMRIKKKEKAEGNNNGKMRVNRMEKWKLKKIRIKKEKAKVHYNILLKGTRF